MKNFPLSNPHLRFLVFVFLTVFLTACVHHEKVPAPEEAKTAVWKKISAAAEQWSKGNTLGYADCAAQDIVWIDELGAQKPVTGIDQLRTYLETFKGQIPEHEFKLLDPLFQVYDDVVIVTYRYQGIFNGEPQAPWKVTSVYRYIDGDWWSEHENWTEVKTT
jgi:hypothetical protein